MRILEDLTTQCLQLLHRAGLEHAEAILPLSRNTLVQRLADASRELAISPGVTPAVLIEKIRTAAEKKRAGKLSATDLHELWWDLPGNVSRGLPGEDDFPLWGRDRDLDDAGLPGDDDFEFGTDDKGEEEPER